MALVAYDDSDMENSDEEEDEEPNHKTAKVEIITNAKPTSPANNETDASLFSSLPLPNTGSRGIVSEEDDDIFLHKKESPKDLVKPPKATVKITIPALSKISDIPKLSTGRSEGKKATTRLLSMLPDPKFNQPSLSALNGQKFIPRTVNVTKPSVQKTQKAVPVAAKLTSYASDESDAEEGTDSTQDFFSLHSSADDTLEIEPDVQIPNEIKVQADLKIPEYVEPPSAVKESYITDGNTEEIQGTSSGALPEDNEVPAQLDEETIIKLCGIRGKHKKDLQIIDVNQKEILPDSREWLLKAITENTSQRASASKRRGDQPSNQQKRKHQITYLAHQAKANEQELQNQWANNRMSRKQTQSKYGF